PNDPVTNICQAADKQLFTLVEWAKRVPHFSGLPLDDQVILLRAGQEEFREFRGHGLLAQQFWGVTGRLQAAQARYRQRSLDRIRRQLHIAGSPPLSEEELELMLESGQSEIFVSNVLGSARAARAALDEVGERHRELQRLERGLRELGELFQLLGGTVEAQGELIDRIERHVQDSGARLEKGRGHLRQAGRSQRGARK
ncbi:syntaxin-4-like, partial [Cyanistes caeruleus]|uniref:syntaxin-4-like n=1 Tax=Cyanistes caeruleus TaxID=156563 RepID=UPI000CDAFA3A